MKAKAGKKTKVGAKPKENLTVPIHNSEGKKVGSHTQTIHAGSATQGGKGFPGAVPLAPRGVTNLPTPFPGASKGK